MKKYNRKKHKKNGLDEYDRRLDKKRKKYGKKINAQDCIEPYQVYVRDNQVERAYKILERMLKKDRVMETYRERLHYKKPSEEKNEKNKTKKITALNDSRKFFKLADSYLKLF